jgi:hypothetical protein
MCEHAETNGERRKRRLVRFMTATVVRRDPPAATSGPTSMLPWR